MGGTEVKQVLIVEDHAIARRGLSSLVRQEPDLEVCGEAGTVAAAVEAARRCGPDVAVVNIGVDAGGGLELVRQLHRDHPHLAILALSNHDEVFCAERALRAGAKGYALQTESCEQVIRALHDVIDGRVYVSDEMANRMVSSMVEGRGDAPAEPISRLTDRELEIFELLGRGLQTREIASRLHISVGTVDAHREHIKKKLNVESAGKLLVRAIQWAQFPRV